MNRKTVDKRKDSRTSIVPFSNREAAPANHPVIVNLSPGGVCLWLREPPPDEHDLGLKFRLGGHERILPSKIVWTRLCAVASESGDTALADGWLAGFAFADKVTSITGDSHEKLGNSNMTVSILSEHHVVGYSQKATEGDGAVPGLISFSKKSVVSIKAAAEELLPVLAEHFTDVHMIVTHDRLEISAPFRHPKEPSPSKARRRNYPVTQASQTVQSSTAMVLEPAQSVTPIQPANIEHVADAIQPRHAPENKHRRRGMIATATLATVILGWTALGISHKSGARPGTQSLPVEGQNIPVWAAGIDQSSLNGWIQIQRKFDLPDTAIRSAIRTLRADDKYSPGQMLYDLTKYPAQVERAFSLLARSTRAKDRSLAISSLENDLKGRVTEGQRFPDEPPGGAYSQLN